MDKQPNIPRLPKAFFKWYCKKNRYEELHGDLEEFFYERAIDIGSSKARLYYWRDVIRCCQPYAWKKPHFLINLNLVMYKNYFKTAFRSALRNPMSSFINVFGLSVAIGMCLVVYAFYKSDIELDRFHEHKDEVFLTTIFADRDGAISEYGMSPGPLAKQLKQDFPYVEKVSRLLNSRAVVKFGEHVFYENIKYVDPEYLEMLTFPLKWGQPASLKDINSIILSEEMSIKYFGESNPLGEELLLKIDNVRKPFVVAGVAEAFPREHIIEFDFLINFESSKTTRPNSDFNSWKSYVGATLIQVDEPSSIDKIAQGMDKYRSLQNKANSDWIITDFGFHSIHDLHYASADIINGISSDSSAPGRIALPIIAILMLVLACLNYINMAISSATKRLKEIGVRKVIGANRRRVIAQFLAENMLMTFFALVIGIFMGILVFFPWFQELTQLPMELDFMDVQIWIFAALLLVGTGIVSGAYPAFYISGFEAVKIFRGRLSFGKKNPLTKIFLGFQLILACMMVTGAIVFIQNTDFQRERGRGYDYDNVLYTNLENAADYEKLRSAMAANASVLKIAGGTNHIGGGHWTVQVSEPDRKYEVIEMNVGPDYLQTVGVRLKSGELFASGATSEVRTVVVNETLVRKLNIVEPIGYLLTVDSVRYQVVGVVDDFHAYNFGRSIKPTLFKLVDEKDFNFLTIQVREGSEKAVYAELKAQWLQLFPEVPMLGGLQRDIWGGYFQLIDVYERFNKAIAGIAIILAALGLYGLLSLNISGRHKEFSIRKALGANTRHIASGMLRQYAVLTITALTIGAPISYFAVKAQLNLVFVYSLPMNYFSVLLATFSLVTLLCLVIGSKVFQIIKFNPVSGLRAE